MMQRSRAPPYITSRSPPPPPTATTLLPSRLPTAAQNEDGNMFYIIRDGEVKCTKAGVEEEVSRRLIRGDFFGELALLSSDKRKATVTAVKPTTVLTLKREEFERLLGPLKDTILETSTANQTSDR